MDQPRPQEPQSEDRQGLTAGEIRWIVGGVLAIFFGIFIAQNADTVDVQFVFFSARVRLIWVFLICAVFGAVLDRLLQRRGVLPPMRRRQHSDGKRGRKAQ